LGAGCALSTSVRGATGWCVWLNLGSDPATGKRLRKRVEARTKRAAESKATALRERHARGENIMDKARTLGELLDDWLATIERQIQCVSRKLVAKPPKDGTERLLSLGPKMTAQLRQHRWNQAEERDAMEWENSGYIFVSTKNGGVCSPGVIYYAFKTIAKAAGTEPARLHDCRDTAATKLLSEGEDIATVAEVLGHAGPQVTAKVYAHALPHKVAGASRRLEDLYEE
jgi:integrase